MAGKVLDFLEHALPTAGAVVGGIAGEAVDPFGGGVVGAGLGSALGRVGENATTGQGLGKDVTQSAIGGAVGQGVGSVIGAGLESVAPEATTIAGKSIAGVGKGALVGGTSSTAAAVAEGQKPTGKNLGLDFLQGAETGGALGGVAGGITGAREGLSGQTPLDQNGGINNQPVPKPSNQFSQEDLQKMAESDDPKAIEKQLKPVTGEVVAQQIASSIAKSTDPNVAANIIDNSVGKKLLPANTISNQPDLFAQSSAMNGQSPENRNVQIQQNNNPNLTVNSSQNVQSPAPAPETTPLPPITDTSDVNTPQQVQEQGSALEGSYNPEEQSLYASQPEPSFLNAPGEAPAPSKVNRLGAVTGMHDILNSGGSTDEALNHYMENVPDSNMQDAQSALNEVIQKAGYGGSLDRSKINANLNPQYENVNFPEAKSRDAAILNGQYANNKVIQAGRPAVDAMQQLNTHDLDLVRSLRGRDPALVINQANDPEQFAKVANALKDYNDYTQASGAQLGQDIPYRQNYGLRTPYVPPEDRAAASETPNAALPENTSYTKQRIYQTHEDAIANGEVPRNANALEDLQQDIGQRSHDQSQLALAKGLENAYPGQVKIINDGQTPAGYRQLLIPNGDKIFMPRDIADQINERQMVGQSSSKTLRAYDQLNAAGKNLELGGGLFHGFNTGGIFTGQQLASGKFFSNPGATGNVVANLLSKNATDNYMSDIGKEGTFDEHHSVINAADATGLNTKHVASDVGSPEDKGLVGKISSIPGLKQVHQAIFERQIPTMMLETFRQKIAGLDIFGNADDREQGIKIAKAINNEYGHLNRDIQGLTPKQFKLASRAVLAADYQEGQLRTLANAFNSKNFGTAEGKLAREAVFGKALVFGGMAALGGVAGGEFKGDNAKQTALAIMNKAINPSFDIGGYKVGLPATQISNVAKPVEESISSAKKGEGIAEGPEDFLSSHAAFVPSKAEEFGTNKNYEGNPVYGTDYFGRPISAVDTAENAVSGVLPIPLAQTAQTASGNQSVVVAAANTAGFNVSPQYNLNYAPVAGQTYVSELEKTPGVSKQKIQSSSEFFDLLGQGSKGKTKTIDAAEKAIIAKKPKEADQIIANYNKQLFEKLVPWAKQGGAGYLDSTMLQLLQTAEITYKKANENVSYDEKTNPTAYGVPIQALSQAPQSTQVAQTTNSGGQ